MYCKYCGNKVNDEAYVCLGCGHIIDRENTAIPSRLKVKRTKKPKNISGILSIVAATASIIAILLCLMGDISSVGKYTFIYERISYGIRYVLFPIVFATSSIILSLAERNKLLNKMGLGMSLISIFFILTEVIVVVIY